MMRSQCADFSYPSPFAPRYFYLVRRHGQANVITKSKHFSTVPFVPLCLYCHIHFILAYAVVAPFFPRFRRAQTGARVATTREAVWLPRFADRIDSVGLNAAGFSRLKNLMGGILGWIKDVDPSLPAY